MADVYNVFCIGTGHTRDESNNTMVQLFNDCRGTEGIDKCIVDGPLLDGFLRAITGGGLNEKLAGILDPISRARPHKVNMTGHSRGAILCHMLAHAMRGDRNLRNAEINMILIDPVHQSKFKHDGAEALDNPQVKHYHAIIMENENTRIGKWGMGPKMYPFKFVEVAKAKWRKRIYYINMPGTHGSGTQAETHPVAKVAMELIRHFMVAHNTNFGEGVKDAEEMCDLFADINVKLQWVNGGRVIWDDDPQAQVHEAGKETLQSSGTRQGAIQKALALNKSFEPNRRGTPEYVRRLAIIPDQPHDQVPYFINDVHASFFKDAFPYFYQVLTSHGQVRKDDVEYFQAQRRMRRKEALAATWSILQPLLSQKFLPEGVVIGRR